MDKKWGMACLLGALVFPEAYAEIQVYRWKDKDGNTVVGDAPPKSEIPVEKITVKEPPPPSRPVRGSGPPSSRAPDWKKEERDLRNRVDRRQETEANMERNSEKKQRFCEDARARQAYVESIRDRAIWRTDPATGEQTLVSDEDRAVMESEARSAIQRGGCETQ